MNSASLFEGACFLLGTIFGALALIAPFAVLWLIFNSKLAVMIGGTCVYAIGGYLMIRNDIAVKIEEPSSSFSLGFYLFIICMGSMIALALLIYPLQFFGELQ